MLWLDDVRDPRDHGFGTPEDHVHWVRAADTAISFLTHQKYDEISLDHDLGPPNCGTGYDVALFIEERCYLGKMVCPVWHIHSSNPVGRQKMEAALQNAEKYSQLSINEKDNLGNVGNCS